MSEFFFQRPNRQDATVSYFGTGHMYTDIDIYIYGECIDIGRPCSMCFCYRSCEEGRGETGSQAELVVELVPWETCSIAQWSGYIDTLVMYGAQHEYILDDKDVDEYNIAVNLNSLLI